MNSNKDFLKRFIAKKRLADYGTKKNERIKNSANVRYRTVHFLTACT